MRSTFVFELAGRCAARLVAETSMMVRPMLGSVAPTPAAVLIGGLLASGLNAGPVFAQEQVAAAQPQTSAAPLSIDYARQIRPLLSDRCFRCHGPDEAQRQGGLRLDQRDAATAKLDSGATAIQPGDSSRSELVARILSKDPDKQMPPPDSGKTLSANEIGLLKAWVEQGANWKDHWSFVKPSRPATPSTRHAPLVGNPIDSFVMSRLEREGIEPSPAADKVTLVRRATLDLTGLPPTPAEVDSFVADAAPDAYERLLDRLLKSPRYGEQMGRYWLDAVRYCDTHGLHLDNERSMWPYREWVINAFNNNLPFDRFTVEQVAGDLLPNATLSQKVASGFNRCNVSTSECGSINDEVLVRYAVDRTEAIGTVWLGLTLGCSVCHNHKYDPISQKEFYQLYAFFNAAADPAMDGNNLLTPPVMKIPSDEQTTKLKTLDDQVADLRRQFSEALAKVDYQEPTADPAKPSGGPFEHVWIDDDTPTKARQQGDTPWEFVAAPQPVLSGSKSSKRSASGLSQHFFTEADPPLLVGEGDKLFAYVYLDPIEPPKEIMLQWNDGAWEHRAVWGENLIEWGQTGTASRQLIGPLPKVGEWVRLEVEAAKVGLGPGARIQGWAFTQHGGTVYWDKAGIVTRTPQGGQSFESLAAWTAFERGQAKSTLPGPVQEAVKADPEKRSDEQKKRLREHFLEFVYPKTRAEFEPLRKRIDELTKQRNDLDASIPSTLVMADMPQPRDTFILVRGQYDKRGEKVAVGVPAILPPLAPEAPRNRLGLAQWLVSPEHPLTARVTVNRLWQQLFGAGIVKTAEDFGSQGQPPTHPELLDWLATEFQAGGWNVKSFLKMVMMSHTYRQTSRVSPALAQRDPANELLARGPRFRLDAEVLRDSALAVSGLLVERQGGKSVKPYQPDGLWEAVGFVGSNTSVFKQDAGDSLYRRSMYTFWKRTSPPPSLATFDAPSRETCTVRRARTNTPLQALVLMNDKQFVEAARKMAERLFREGGDNFDSRAAYGFRLATGRLPTAAESAVLRRVYEAQRKLFEADKGAAEQLLAYGEAKRDPAFDAADLAAHTMVANLLLNLDETVTKE
ncbi:MAG: PSD1 and planctomycete cytochrome C domain-containing protein [Planctomycetota bacterium]